MNILINDTYFNEPRQELKNPLTRYGSRGLVFNKNKIAIFYKKSINQYKLPGGGIEQNETGEEAFIREVKEETGCTITNVKKIGQTTEEKGKENFIQISDIFTCDVISINKPSMTQQEIDEGGKLLWLTIDEAIDKIKQSLLNLKDSKYDSVYRIKFMSARDLEILKHYKNLSI